MQVEATGKPLAEAGADVEAMPLFEGGELPEALREVPGAADAKPGFKKLTMLRPDGSRRVLVVGLGDPAELDAERLRVAAALATRQASTYETRSLAWQLPDRDELGAAEAVAALVEGTILAGFRFDRYRSADP